MASAPPRPIPRIADLPLVVETQRLVLRPLELGDADAPFAFASDAEVSKWMSWDPHADRNVTVAFLERMIAAREAGTSVGWAIVVDGKPVGVISIDGITWHFRAWRVDRAEMGYWLGRPHWGKGLMSEAATAALRFGFETLGLHKVTIGCVDGNAASRAIIEKLGFRFLALYQDDFYRFGRWWDHRRYEQTVSEWGDSTRTLRFNRPRTPGE
jgi:ribosomal-protein-alanine N-acetyltransferase